MVKATGEICEKPVNSHCVYPVIVFHIWVLTEVEMQELVFISKGVWVHLQVGVKYVKFDFWGQT